MTLYHYMHAKDRMKQIFFYLEGISFTYYQGIILELRRRDIPPDKVLLTMAKS